jgi:hypothetical protein
MCYIAVINNEFFSTVSQTFGRTVPKFASGENHKANTSPQFSLYPFPSIVLLVYHTVAWKVFSYSNCTWMLCPSIPNTCKYSYHFVTSYSKKKLQWELTQCETFRNSFFSTVSLGAFAKLRKATLSFIMSLCPSGRLSVCLRETIRFPLDGFS